MGNIPTWTYILDALGVFGVIVGGYVATKSSYSRQNSKEAAELIQTLIVAKEEQAKEIAKLKTDRESDHAVLNDLQGQLKAYKALQTVPANVIKTLLETQNEILKALSTKA